MNATKTSSKPARRRSQEPASLPMWLTIVAQAAEAKAEHLQEGSK